MNLLQKPKTDRVLVVIEENKMQIAAGSSHTCFLLNTGEVKCTGINNFGQLGDGTNVKRNSPVNTLID